MTEAHTENNPELDRPGYEWPIGGLVRIRDDADFTEEHLPLRGELAVVVGPMGMVVSDIDSGPLWAWVQKVYCPYRREYVFVHPDEVVVAGGEPTERGIRDVMTRTTELFRAGLARPEDDGTGLPPQSPPPAAPERGAGDDASLKRPATAPAAPGKRRRPQEEEDQS